MLSPSQLIGNFRLLLSFLSFFRFLSDLKCSDRHQKFAYPYHYSTDGVKSQYFYGKIRGEEGKYAIIGVDI